MILYGASGHAKVIIDILEKSGVAIDYLVDANPDIRELMGYKVVHDSLYRPSAGDEIVIAIGANRTRKSVAENLKTGFGWAVHPSALLGDDVSIGKGTVIMAGAVVNSSASIGDHVIINTAASVDHDCIIGDYAHVAPKATLCGEVVIGEGAWIGAAAVAIPGINVGRWATVGAGTVLIRDVPDHATVVGNPGRIIQSNGG